MHIGAGRVVKQAVLRIDELIDPDTGTFGDDSGAIIELIRQAKLTGRPLHVMGLASEGNVHASLEHLYAVLRTAKREGLTDVNIHAFTDGRDTPRDSGTSWLRKIHDVTAAVGVGEIVTVMGRFWALDRNGNTERTFRAYNTLLTGSDVPAALDDHDHHHDHHRVVGGDDAHRL